MGRPAGLAVALELLRCDEVLSVQMLARATGVSVAAVHATIAELKTVGLVSQGCPRHPDLPGWAEVGDRAAQAVGVRVAAESGPRFYVPDRRALTSWDRLPEGLQRVW